MEIMIDLFLPAVFGFTLSEAIRGRKGWVIFLCFICAFSYAYLKYYPAVAIQVKPELTSIYVNGRRVGEGQKEYRVPFGSHQLRFNYDDSPFYRELLEEVQTNFVYTKKIERVLEPKRGDLYVSLKPSSTSSYFPKADVTINNGINYNKTIRQQRYFSFKNIPSGVYVVQIEYEESGIPRERCLRDVCVLEEVSANIEVYF